MYLQVIADQLLWKAVKESKVIREGSSEEDPIVQNVKVTPSLFIVSNIHTNDLAI